MKDETCTHSWEMMNVQPGFIITENCFRCDMISTYFSLEERPPLEEYREGDHFWNVMGSAQSIRFDLKCSKCSYLMTFEELCGLMMCTGCDEKCKIYKLMKEYEKERTWVYVAFGYLPIEGRKKLSPEKILALEQYFNQRRKSSTSKIKIVSDELVDNIRNCYAELIRDIDMISLKPPENK
ncbi:MAG: hypothetical protein NTU44_01735 [Bacteroidetes bacterium]|nr:hypothetical protein [Bacteroidota bacterium]